MMKELSIIDKIFNKRADYRELLHTCFDNVKKYKLILCIGRKTRLEILNEKEAKQVFGYISELSGRLRIFDMEIYVVDADEYLEVAIQKVDE